MAVVFRDIAVCPPHTLLDRFEEKARQRYAKRAEALDMDIEDYLEELSNHVTKLVADTEIWMRRRPQTLWSILRDGRFKSQFETHRSGGTYDLPARRDTEEAFFGYPEKLAHERRPVYGYLTSEPFGRFGLTSEDEVGFYGKVAIRFKKWQVARKVTFTLEDSLSEGSMKEGLSLVPVPLLAPSYHALSLRRSYYTDYLHEWVTLHDVDPYAEIQLHEGLYIDDIAEVVFFDRYGVDADLENELENRGIPYCFESY